MDDVKNELNSLWQDYPGLLAGPGESVPSEAQLLPSTEPPVADRSAPTEAESWSVHPPQEAQPPGSDDPTRDWYAGLKQDAAEAELDAAHHRTELVEAVENDDYFAGMQAVRMPDQTWRRGDDDIIGLPTGAGAKTHSHRWKPSFRLARH